MPPLSTARDALRGRGVFATSLLLCAVVAVWGIVDADGLTAVGHAVQSTAFDNLGWLFMGSVTAFVGLCVWLAFGPYGRLKLGKPDDEPEFSTLSWLSMLFAAGMGVGLLFWGVAEPVIHYTHPPVPPGGTPTAARQALVQTLFHWGFHAWAVYSIGGLVLAYFGFRKGEPYLPGAPLRHVFRGAWVGPVATAADLIGVLAVAAGVAGSVGMGILQLHTGLHVVFGVSATSTWVALGILVVLVVAYMASASTGLDKGIKWLSNINMATAVALLLFLLVAGPTSFLLDVAVTSAGDYVAAIPAMSLRLFPFRDLGSWTSSWTLTYFIWWIAWAPFVGVFIARISRGRTIRSYLIGVTLAPTLFSVVWFGVFGGTGIFEELHGAGGVAQLVSEDVTVALFALFERVPLTMVLSVVTLGLLFVFLVTSCDSATYVLGMLSSGGSLVPSTGRKLLWGVVIGSLGAALMLTGNIEVLKSVVVTGAVPFTFVMLLQVVALLKALKRERGVLREASPSQRPRRTRSGGDRVDATGVGSGAALLLLATFSLGALTGCGGGEPTLRIGAKAFDEQVILASMGRQLCDRAGLSTAPVVDCVDTYGCHEALLRGEIDAMVEYSGTALRFAGITTDDGESALAAARRHDRTLGLEWLGGLGFDNGYRVVMRQDQAHALGIDSLDTLGVRLAPIRVACPAEYLRRPADGLEPLARRYGLRLTSDPRVAAAPSARLQALIDGRVDVAVLYATDGAMTDPRIVALDDPRGFFPPYEAAFVVHTDAMSRHPRLLDTLGALEGRIDTPTMQRLAFAVQEEGKGTDAVARAFLLDEGLLDADDDPTSRDRPLILATAADDTLHGAVATARRAVREVFPRRAVEQLETPVPLDAVRDGTARLAVVGAERFFRPAAGNTRARVEGAEALAVLGFRAVHVLRRSGDRGAALDGRVGIPAIGSGGAELAEAMLAAAGGVASASADRDTLLRQLRGRELDAVLLLDTPGSVALAEALADGALTLIPLDGWLSPARAARIPYLRATRLPVGTYAGLETPLETVGTQVVLAGPAPSRTPIGRAGPAAALDSRTLPLSRETALALADAAGKLETPDPALPSVWSRPGPPAAGTRAPLDTLLNVVAFAFLGWLGWLGVRRETCVDAVE